MREVGTKQESWHLDKKVPIAMIVALLIQGSTFIWYAAKIDARVAEVESHQKSFDVWRDGTQDKLSRISEFLGRMDERFQSMSVLLVDIKQSLRK